MNVSCKWKLGATDVVTEYNSAVAWYHQMVQKLNKDSVNT